MTFAESTVQISNLRGVEIRNFSGAGVVIAPTNGNEHVNIINCNIHDNDCGIMMNSGKFHSVTDSVIGYNEFFGISVGSSVQGVNIAGSAIQGNQRSGIRLAGQNHVVSGCYIVSNGMAEQFATDFGGVVFGSTGTSATGCQLTNSTVAANTPYGAKLVAGSNNRVLTNETYFNTTKGIRTVGAPQQPVPNLSHFVVDDVHGKIFLQGSLSGIANTNARIEIFLADGISLTQGAAIAIAGNLTLNSSGTVSFFTGFNRNVTWYAQAANPPGPYTIAINNTHRIVATSTDLSLDAGTSEFSAASLGTLTGDYNLDGNVDGADYVTWRNNEGATNAVYTQGDGDFDGDVDSDDYDIWHDHYGQTP